MPSFSFNESLLMDPVFDPKTSFGKKFRRFQEWSVTNLRWPMPIFNARGIFQYSFGTIPHRLPITVVGKFLALKLWSFLGSLLISIKLQNIEALLYRPKIQHFTETLVMSLLRTCYKKASPAKRVNYAFSKCNKWRKCCGKVVHLSQKTHQTTKPMAS